MNFRIYSYKTERLKEFNEELVKNKLFDKIVKVNIVQNKNFLVTDNFICLNINYPNEIKIVEFAKKYFKVPLEYYSYYKMLRI